MSFFSLAPMTRFFGAVHKSFCKQGSRLDLLATSCRLIIIQIESDIRVFFLFLFAFTTNNTVIVSRFSRCFQWKWERNGSKLDIERTELGKHFNSPPRFPTWVKPFGETAWDSCFSKIGVSMLLRNRIYIELNKLLGNIQGVGGMQNDRVR